MLNLSLINLNLILLAKQLTIIISVKHDKYNCYYIRLEP